MTLTEESTEENLITESKTIMDYINTSQIYEVDPEGRVKCKICQNIIKISLKDGTTPLNKHMITEKHRRNMSVNNKKESLEITPDQWHMTVLKWMTENKIPLSRLDDEKFSSFIENFSGKTLFSSTHYKNSVLPKLYGLNIHGLLSSIKNKPFYIMFDESPDRLNRKIINILVGELSSGEAKKPFILNTIELEHVDSSSIVREINFTIQKFFSDASEALNFKLLISDKASYCLKVGKMLKIIYPDMKHVTCLCHGLHNFAELIRNRCPTINKFISKFKKLLKNNSKNKKLFKNITKISLPPFPIMTRWGTWLDCALWFYNNSSLVTLFLDEHVAINLKKQFDKPSFDREYREIQEFLRLPRIIKSLESSNLSVYQHLDLLNEARNLIQDSAIKDQFDHIFDTNPDLQFFKSFSGIKSNEKYYMYAPLTSCWVERSFSAMKQILSDNRNLSVDTLKQLLGIYFNKNS